jgi:glucose/arabinose dehydrogenase
MKRYLILLAVLAAAALGVAAQGPPGQAVTGPVVHPDYGVPPNAPNQKPAFAGQTDAPEAKSNVAFDVVPVVDGALGNPWGMVFLPDGRMLVTEKGAQRGAETVPGQLRIVTAAGQVSAPVAGVPMVDARGQGGLLDVTIDPNYAQNQLVYISYSEWVDGKNNNTAVARGKLVDGAAPRLDNVQVIYKQVPAFPSTLHFGSRLVWHRDGTLFVTQGDRSNVPGRMQSQQMDSGLGKIVRINADGSIPKDNPFVGKQGVRPEIWSFGHRNVQAAALHPTTGELWEVEHGTRGGDEVNVAKKGKDYGWPTIAYGIEYQGPAITGGIQQQAGMEQPVYYWDPNIAPSGLMFYTGTLFPAWRNNLFVGGLASTALVRLTLDGEKVTGEERLLRDRKQRIRDVNQGPDGAIYLLTDGPKGSLLKIVPKK